MGLYVSHDCWRGSYSYFMWWRREIARIAGLPPLDLMEGFCCCKDDINYWMRVREKVVPDHIMRSLPIQWSCLKRDPIHRLLRHSDCDGSITWRYLLPITKRLDELLQHALAENMWEGDPEMGKFMIERTPRFLDGLRKAHEARERITFG